MKGSTSSSTYKPSSISLSWLAESAAVVLPALVASAMVDLELWPRLGAPPFDVISFLPALISSVLLRLFDYMTLEIR